MSIKKCLLSLFMTMLLVIMIAGCMSGNDLSNMECVSKNTSTMEAVAEKSADASMPNREKSNENRTTQVSADRSVIEESSVETDTETLNAPTEVSTEMLSNIPTETYEETMKKAEKQGSDYECGYYDKKWERSRGR